MATNMVQPAAKLDVAMALFGSMGEVKVESTDSTKQFCLGVYADGMYERRNTLVGSFVYKKYDIKTPYLTTTGSNSFEFKLPKIPGGILKATVKFFRAIMSRIKNSESMVQIWWNKKTEKYFVYVPVQRVAGASIKFDHSKDLQNNSDYVWVVDIH